MVAASGVSVLDQRMPGLRSGFKHFLSLRWKIIAPLSLVLLAVNATLSYINYDGQRSELEALRASSEAHSERFASQVIRQLGSQLETLASLIPNLSDVHDALVLGDGAALQMYYQRYWSTLHLNSNLEQILFFKPDGSLLSSWREDNSHHISPRLAALAKRVITDERPQRLLVCNGTCLYYYIVPVLDQGHSVAAVAVAASLADAVLAFQHMTDTHIAIVAPYTTPSQNDLKQVQLLTLKRRVLAISGGAKSIAVLQNVQTGNLNAPLRMSAQYQNRHYEILPVPLPNIATIGSPGMLVMFDRTDSLHHLNRVAWRSVEVGMAGLVISELMLLALLWLPLRRFTRITQALPLLGERQFDAARAQLVHAGAAQKLADELNVFSAHTLNLIDSLEDLQTRNTAHADELSKLVRQLSQERDFVSGLLDTAQVLIITQDGQGRILMANAYVLALTGYDYMDLHGAPMSTYFSLPDQAHTLRQQISGLLHSDGASLRQESPLRCRNGEMRDIVWIHSALAGENPEDAAILSVGLDITELRRVEQQAHYLAEYDALTGLYNRHRFQEALQTLLSHAAEPTTGVLIYLDLDEFKSLNDTAGHSAADNVLHAVASQLQGMLPAPALIGRLGGDDFALVFTHLDAARAVQVARHIQLSLGNIVLAEVPLNHKVSACIGIAEFPSHGTVAQELLANADLALFRAKENGRGSMHLYAPDEGLMERVLNRVYWVDKIEQALKEDQFTLHFQPIMALADHTISHHEALVRMNNPTGGLHAPGEFIGVAEATGLIRGIDQLVLKKSIQALAEMQRSAPDAKLSVNLSGRSLSNQGWLELLQHELAHSGVSPSGLILEITETAALEDIASARVWMARVTQLGCVFSLDDFGVGFASFDYLKQLPVDYVKIDGSFIHNLVSNHDDQLFVQALVQTAHAFNKQVVAEFVTSQAIVDLLIEYGVDFAQGYFIGEPKLDWQA